jgi:hypothetical protein
MTQESPDQADYRFLTSSGATLVLRLVRSRKEYEELQILGNRAGLLSLANILMWFRSNAWRREFLSLNELPFVHSEGSLSICFRLTAEDPTGNDGLLSRNDRSEQFEWKISEDDLLRLALSVHRLASMPEHEYDQLQMAAASTVDVEIRMTDASNWLR